VARHPVDKIRNVALISHGGAGKTSLAEEMLFAAGATKRRGRVDEGNSILDFDPEEVERNISINTSMAPCQWKDHKINIMDTPGYFDFVGEVRATLRVSDTALVVIDAVSGVEVGTEVVWNYADEYKLPRAVMVNKLDRENADFSACMDQLVEAFGDKVVPLHLPIGKEAGFRGLVDLLTRKAWVFDEAGNASEEDIPADLMSQVGEYREQLLDAIVERDDELLMMYLEGEELDPAALSAALRSALIDRDVVPVICGSAQKHVGISTILDFIVQCAPSPAELPAVAGQDPRTGEDVRRPARPEEPFSALVFKTMADPYVGKLTLFRVWSGSIKSDSQVYNATQGATERVGQLYTMRGKEQEPIDDAGAGDIVAVAKLQVTTTSDSLCDSNGPVLFPPINFPPPVFSVAVTPKAKGDEEKLSSGLTRLAEEDPTFTVERNRETKQLIISGLGELHLDVMTGRLKRKFGVEVEMKPPRIPYRETIKKQVESHYRHKKQTGGRGQFGDVYLRIGPSEEEFEFVDEVFGGAVPRQYIPAVEKGVRDAMEEGVVAGYPVTGVRVALYDGSYHSVDSSEMAFKIAGSMAFKQGFLQADPTLLEPIVEVAITIPEEFTGDIMGDLNKKRGRILGMEPRGTVQIIRGEVPLAEMARYAIDLRSMTQGRGTFTMKFIRYDEVPSNIRETIIQESAREQQE